MPLPATNETVPRHARYEGFRATVKAVGAGERGRRPLAFAEAREAMRALLAGEVTPAQAGGFMLGMRIKGETVEEMAGMAQALRDAAPELRPPPGRPIVATAGGYDGVVEAPALSLAAAVAAAAAGAGVVVHCGSTLGPKYGITPADVLTALGGVGRPTPAQSEATLDRAGVTLVHAAEALPGWSALAVLRDELGPRGPVHSVEKLVDWFGARRFVVGYAHAAYGQRLTGALHQLGAERAVAVRGLEGSDFLRPGRPTAVTHEGRMTLPEEFGFTLPQTRDVAESAELTRAVLFQEADRVVCYAVALSAGVRLFVAGVTPSVEQGVSAARAAVNDGRARATLDALLS